MPCLKTLPCALTIAGSDSGGGAGIQADLKTFAALGVHGTSAITCLTAQNPKGVRSIQAGSVLIVRQQIEAVFDELPPAAVKTGMLYSARIIEVVASLLNRPKAPPLVVDPVMVATSGARLLKAGAIRSLCKSLLPLASLITPNLHEAEILAERSLESVEDMRAAARTLHQRFGCAVLLKGGHLRGLREAADIYYDGRQELLLCAPFIRGVSTHGTGCTYSAAIAAWLARGQPLPQAVQRAKEFITGAIACANQTGRHGVLNCFWRSRLLD
ncbi:MAG TPA: bifunctional hydroxymethylpyrimidine kinase/phosphomethylpyrimidine kinase [Verrucomicrobiota bacterium]|nr:bifunctional hydroxymethylpyrimidine kinase/phosphomethylpyrimidine kinase [Verrucomicrobiota bacterium]HRT57985.1 bifunctional hydroxymethylpyrimidine kinase/phosphomethylpyrimidine kinase [Candidatus Paceibacterota bacterium]